MKTSLNSFESFFFRVGVVSGLIFANHMPYDRFFHNTCLRLRPGLRVRHMQKLKILHGYLILSYLENTMSSVDRDREVLSALAYFVMLMLMSDV